MDYQILDCCGIGEIKDLREVATPEEALGMLSELYDDGMFEDYYDRQRHLIFSSAHREATKGENTKAGKLAAYLVEKELATITKLPVKKNVRSGNFLYIYIATIEHIGNFNRHIDGLARPTNLTTDRYTQN